MGNIIVFVLSQLIESARVLFLVTFPPGYLPIHETDR